MLGGGGEGERGEIQKKHQYSIDHKQIVKKK